jgi:hypothetical protein
MGNPHKWLYTAYKIDRYRMLVLCNRPSDKTLIFFETREDGTVLRPGKPYMFPAMNCWVPELWNAVHPMARAHIRWLLTLDHSKCSCGDPKQEHDVDALLWIERRKYYKRQCV